MISAGDIVVYGTSGVCKVNGTVEKKTVLGTCEYLELISWRDSSKRTYLPKRDDLLQKVRRALTRDEVISMVDTLKKEEPIVIDDENERNEKLSSMLKSNDCAMTVRVARTLTELQKAREAKGNKLHIGDERLLRLSLKLANDELAYALGIDVDAVAGFLQERISATN